MCVGGRGKLTVIDGPSLIVGRRDSEINKMGILLLNFFIHSLSFLLSSLPLSVCLSVSLSLSLSLSFLLPSLFQDTDSDSSGFSHKRSNSLSSADRLPKVKIHSYTNCNIASPIKTYYMCILHCA